MKPEEIKFGDWMRMFIGETPPEFFIEVIIRVFFIYLLLMISMRLLGKRMAAQISRNEMLAMVCLAAAIGVPLQSPDRGLLPPVIIAIVVVAIGRAVAKLAFKDQKFEHITQDNVSVLVQDGTMQLKVMENTRITPERLFAQLRSEGVTHLGKVKRLYLEANGDFTLIKEEQASAGLSVLPLWDTDFVEERLTPLQEEKVCKDCGKKRNEQDEKTGTCANCGSTEWTKAVR